MAVLAMNANEYGERLRWFIFPCAPRQKTPLIKWRTYSSNFPLNIGEWWQRWPDANLAVDCGKSGLYVVDFDGAEGIAEFRELQAQHEPLPEIPTQQTGGGGLQVFFANPGDLRNTTKVLGAHIDTRGNGGYCILPPSIHPSGNLYAWRIPPTRAPLIEPPPWLIPPAKGEPTGDNTPTGEKSGDGGKWLAEAIRRASLPGCRNKWGFWLAAQLRDDGIPRSEMACIMRQYARAVQNQGDHPYTVQEALKSLHSALHGPRRPPASVVR